MTAVVAGEAVVAGPGALDRLIAGIAEGAVEREREGRRPFAEVDLLRRAGIGALRVPREEGGGGAGVRELFSVVIALAAADVNVAHILRGHFAFVESRLALPEPQRSRWLREVVGGAIVGNASTETGPVTVGAFRWGTTLRPDGDGHRLNGTKYFSTGTLYADLVEVIAGSPDGSTVDVVIPTDRAGVEVVDDWDGFGQRATGTGTTTFRDVRVHADEVLPFPEPAPGEDRPPFYLLGAFFQLYVTALIAGVLRRLVDDAATHVQRRVRSFAWAPAERPAEDPLIQEVVGRLSSAAYAAEATVLAAAAVLEDATSAARRGDDPDNVRAHSASVAAAHAKVVVDGLGQEAASRLFDVGGASIVRAEHALDRHWRNIRTLACHNPTPYKAQALGAVLLTGAPLPGSGYF